jgi:hypothetical protein
MRHTREFLLLPISDEICPVSPSRQMAHQVLPIQDIARLRESFFSKVGAVAGMYVSFHLGRLRGCGSQRSFDRGGEREQEVGW